MAMDSLWRSEQTPWRAERRPQEMHARCSTKGHSEEGGSCLRCVHCANLTPTQLWTVPPLPGDGGKALVALDISVSLLSAHLHRRSINQVGRLPSAMAGAPFKIALFADLHFGEAESTDWGPLRDVNSTRVMSFVLVDENPIEASGGNDEEKVLIGSSDESKDPAASESSIPLSPQ